MKKIFAEVLISTSEQMDVDMDEYIKKEHIPYSGEHIKGVINAKPCLINFIPEEYRPKVVCTTEYMDDEVRMMYLQALTIGHIK